MDDETKATATQEGSQSWEEELGKVDKPAEKPATEVAKTEVPEDHPTKLGRRVSKMEESLNTILDRFDLLLTQQQRVEPTRTQSVDDDDPEIQRIEERLAKRNREKELREQEQNSQYVNRYLRAVKSGTGDVDEELHEAIVKELTEINPLLYKKHTGDPAADGRINYGLAEAKLLRQQRTAAKGAPNVKGDKKNAPTDLSSTSRLGEQPKKVIELDPYAKKFVKSLGLAEDDPWVQESLSRV
jgi:hypothetical protein